MRAHRARPSFQLSHEKKKRKVGRFRRQRRRKKGNKTELAKT